MKRALEYLLQTKVGTSEQYYQASVCVICDEFIIGTSPFVWLPKTKLLKHKTRLSNPDICESLRKCYQVDDDELRDILLSPRAKCTINREYSCCSSCNDVPEHRIIRRVRFYLIPEMINNIFSCPTRSLPELYIPDYII